MKPDRQESRLLEWIRNKRAFLLTLLVIGILLLGLGLRLYDLTDQPIDFHSTRQLRNAVVARAIYYGSRCLILDEPTAALAVRQTQQVLDQVRRARDAGQAVILITHNLEQALSVADSAVVLARGRVVGSYDDPEAQAAEITRLVMKG